MRQDRQTARTSEAPDGELAARAATGDSSAFEVLMRRHNRTLFRTARAILRNDAEAEDALQEAYLQAYRALPGFRAEARFGTWLVRIVANEALVRLRKEARRAQIVPMQSADATAGLEKLPDDPMEQRPEPSAERAQMRRLLETRIDALPDAYRTVFVLRAVEELSVQETAAVLQIPEATVRTRFFRARSLLREALAQQIDLAYADAFAFAGERCDRIVAAVLARLPRS